MDLPLIKKSLTFFLSIIIINVAVMLPLSNQSQPPTTIYDHLRHNGLPVGLLPKGITDFSVDATTGQFRVNLTQPCDAQFENQLHYDFNLSGLLSFGKIENLSGVTQQELFLWFPVKNIRVDVPSSGLIYFDVGVVDKQFSLSLFESHRDCTAAAGESTQSAASNSQNQNRKLALKTAKGDVLKAVL